VEHSPTAMSHPFHKIAVNSAGKTLYIATGQSLKAVDLEDPDARVIAQFDFDQDATADSKKPSKPTTEVKEHIQNLILTRNQQYVVGTSNDDKLALVFGAEKLDLVSKRSFPKRPSAIDTTPDDLTLILGDKFGDVYAVPLTSNEPLVTNDEESATSKNPILGHVSMLLDLVVVEHQEKQYIITADRDEHIRVSLYPHCYVIERWLFAHKEFVSSLGVIPWESSLLISGGGDDFICLWRWTTGELLQKFELRSLVLEFLDEQMHKAPESSLKIEDNEVDNNNRAESQEELDLCVSDIVPVPGLSQLAILCEGTKAVLHVELNDYSLKHVATTVLPHPAISIAVDESSRLYVTYDHPTELIGMFQLKPDTPAKPILLELCSKISENASILLDVGRGVSLYAGKNLRKRAEH
jgi:tRNA (guanine-N(7)-)-methyltransferase subunit TRM82